MVLRRGWGGLVRGVQGGRGGRVGVVSVGWSRGFVGGCLREGGRGRKEEEEDGVGMEVEEVVGDIDIRANEIIYSMLQDGEQGN